jgi:hypothetical protein
MPRTVLPTIAVVGPYPVLPVAALSLDFAFTAADNVNANQFPFTGREVLLVQNTAGAPGTFTLTSIADSSGTHRGHRGLPGRRRPVLRSLTSVVSATDGARRTATSTSPPPPRP